MGLGIFAASTWKTDYRNMARTPPFNRNLLRLWLRYDGGRDTRPPEYYEDAMLEPLWGNVLIWDAQNRPLYYPSVAKCRYSTVGDVYAREPPYPRTKAAQLFPHLLQAIPRAWTNLPSRPFQSGPVTTQWYNSLCLFSTSSEPVFLVCSSTRTIYSRIVEQYQETPICIAKWEKMYGNLSTSQWTLLWKSPPLINVNLIPLFSGTSFGVFLTGFCQRKPIYIDGILVLHRILLPAPLLYQIPSIMPLMHALLGSKLCTER